MPETSTHEQTSTQLSQKLKLANARSESAQEIAYHRRQERHKNIVTYRTADDYEDVFYGLEHLFGYAKENFEDPVVLDEGAGDTRGIKGISERPYAKDMRFLATVLRKDPEVAKHLGNDKTIVTTGETLRGVDDNSIAVILALKSVAYSKIPEMAVESIDRVLMPGGVFKGTFLYPGLDIGRDMQTFAAFQEYFKRRGYDMAREDNMMHTVRVVVAVKPGGAGNVRAKDLLAMDKDLYMSPEKVKERESKFRIREDAELGQRIVVRADMNNAGEKEIRRLLEQELVEKRKKPPEAVELALKLIDDARTLAQRAL